MEYLMTYGWAILVIAIVAALLFALGLFGQSSSNLPEGCMPQTGFICSNPSYTPNGIVLTVGQESGQYYYGDWVFVASTSEHLDSNGLPVNMSFPTNMISVGVLTPGQTATVEFTNGQAGDMPTANVLVGYPFTGYVWLGYCTVPGCGAPTSYTRIGTINTKFSGASAFTGSSSITTSTTSTSTTSSSTTSTSTTSTSSTSTSTTSIRYVPITLSNAQSSPTPSTFQQMLTIDSTKYNLINEINNGWTNVEFSTGNTIADGGTPLYAWCESGCNNSASNTVMWVKLTNAINANSNTIIYMNFMPSNVMASPSSYTGEAPQLPGQPSYGAYDNGANVFLYYNVNPISTAGWTITQSSVGQTSSAPSGSYFGTADALYTTVCQGGGSGLFETAIPNLNYNEIITYWTYASSGNDGGNFYFLDNSTQSGPMALFGVAGYGSGLLSSAGPCGYTNPGGAIFSSGTWYKNDIVIAGTTATYYVGGNSDEIATFGSQINSVSISSRGDYIGLDTNYDYGSGNGNTYYNGFLIRAYPPGGAMPSANVGNVI